MLRCGLLGKKLIHSYSPGIHKMLGDYEYSLYEKSEDEIEAFMRCGKWDALNVTIPYKKTVIPYIDSFSPSAELTGSVNTVIRRDDNSLFGDNTDVYGFLQTVRHSGICVKSKKVLVLGSGGACSAVCAALSELNAQSVVIISRSGENNYDNLEKHCDADIIINTTPLGMYPKTGISPLDLSRFPKLSGVFDLIYNPARTALLLQAEKLGIPFANGLYMLIAQAKRSSELFTGKAINDCEIDRIYAELSLASENIILIGMPGVGKSTVANELGRITGRRVFDSDDEITKAVGKSPEQIIRNQGEGEFRKIEHEVLANLGKQSGTVIATGGGIVVNDANYDILHQNGIMIWLQKDIDTLCDDGRPILQSLGAKELYSQREHLYRKFADITVNIASEVEVSVKRVITEINRRYSK